LGKKYSRLTGECGKRIPYREADAMTYGIYYSADIQDGLVSRKSVGNNGETMFRATPYEN